MKKILKLFVCLLCSSCQEKKEVINYYDNGQIKSKGWAINNSIEDSATVYYPNGIIKEKGYWQNNKQEGRWLMFDSLGQKHAIIEFKNDLQDGISIFYENGKITQESSWKKGVLNGPGKMFYPNGSVKILINWLDGKRHGKVIQFDSTNKIVKEEYWRNGVQVL